MTPASRILTAVAAELDGSHKAISSAELYVRVVTAAYRIYDSASSYTAHRQARAALAIAPAIKPNSNRTSYLTALKGALR